MAAKIRIKRSGVTGNPNTLAVGELAYSWLTEDGSPNGGDRLYIGTGTETGGNAANHTVIGGKYFTDMLDHTKGVLTASSALLVDANKKLDDLLVDNLELNGNTLSTTDTNGNLILNPNGTGKVSIANTWTLPRSAGTNGYVLTTDGSGTASWAQASSNLAIAGTTGTDSVSLLNDTLTFAGGTTPISIAVTDNTVTVSVADATTSSKGLASFNSTYFTVSSGAVSINDEYIQDAIGAMVSSNSETNISVTYDDTNGKLDFSVNTASSSTLGVASFSPSYFTVTSGDVAINNATTSTKGIASFDSTDFTVSSGAVTLNAERVQDIVGGMVTGNTESGISVTYNDTDGVLDFNVNDPVITIAGDVDGSATMTNLGDTTITVTLDTVNTNVGSFGSTTKIPTFTVNGKGLITAAGEVSVATSLSIAGDTGTDSVSLLTDTLTYSGSGAIHTAVTNNTLTVSVDTATSSTKGVAKFNTSGFVVSGGDVTLTGSVAQSVSSDSGSATPSTNAFTIAGTSGQGISTSATGSTVTITAADATTSTKGVASFSSSTFAVTSGAVTVKAGGISNSQLANSSVTVGTTSISLGSSSTSLTGLTQVDIGNVQISGNSISSTDTNGNISLDPNGTGTVDVSNSRITSIADPVNPQDAATKAYVDASRSGLDVKESVRVATTANITLSNTQTIDGVALAVGNRVLVKNQSTASENGIYVVASTSWTRASDFDNTPGTEVTSGAFTFVEEGTVNADSGWVLTTDGTITLGTTSLTFVQFSGAGQITAGSGLSKTGNTLDVNVANGIEIVSDNVQLANTVAGDGLTYASGVLNIGGTSNRITVNSDSIDIASTYVGQSSITTLGTITTGTWHGDTITTGYGGTGFTSFSAYDLLTGKSDGTLQKLAIGTAGQFLQVNSAGDALVYGDIDGGTY